MTQNLIQLCRSHGIAYPVECAINSSKYTCYNYGPMGARLRRNINTEWWNSCSRVQGKIYLVEGPGFNDGSLSSKPKTTANIFKSSLAKETLTHYLSTLTLVKSRLPFGLAQIGQTNVLPDKGESHHFLYSSAKQTEMTLQFFVAPSEASEWMDRWRNVRLQWWKKFARNLTNFSDSVTEPSDTNPSQTFNIQYKFPWGCDSLETICNHGNQPLVDLEDMLGVSLKGYQGKTPVLPEVLELNTTVDRALAALLVSCYQDQGQQTSHCALQDNRTVLRLHPRLAPYFVAIVTEGAHEMHNISELAEFLSAEMRGQGISVLDTTEAFGSLVHPTVKFDEMGVMWTVILSKTTLKTGIALLRNRDTTLKEKISIADLCRRLMKHRNSS